MTLRVAIDARKAEDFGIGTYIRGLVAGLESLDDDLELVLITSPEYRELFDPGHEVVEAKSPGYSLRELVEVNRLANRARVDLLHLPHYVVPFGSLPMTVTIHDLIHLRLPGLSPAARVYARLMLGRAVRKTKAIFTPTRAVFDELSERWPGVSGKILVTPNGVSESLLNVEPGALPAGVEGERFILFVGNDKPHKNVETLITSFSRVRERFPGLRLVLAGGSFERIEEPEVIAAGRIDEGTLRRLYEEASLLVQPSLMEGFGLPVLEAMAFGTPVAVSAIPPLLEVAGEEAVRFDPRDPNGMAAAITSLLGDAAAEKERRRGVEQSKRFSWVTSARKTLETWRRVLSRS